MKRLLLLMLLPAVATVLGGCRKERQEAMTLSITPSGPIVYEAEGGTTKVTVTTNQKTWEVQAARNQKWCTVEEVEGSSFVVKASVNKNREEERQTKVTVTTGTGRDAKRVVLEVTQRKAQAPFDIKITEITDTEATITVVPRDKENRYFCDIIEKNSLQYFNDDIGEFVSQLMDFAASWYGSMEAAVLILTGKGEQTKTINKLQPGVECVGYAVGLSEDGKMNTEIESVDFWTQKAQTDKNGQKIEAVGDRIWWENRIGKE